MRLKKITALLLGTALTASMLAGCGNDATADTSTDAPATDTTVVADAGDDTTDAAPAAEEKEYSEDEIVDFTMFIGMPGSEINDGNEIQEIIAKKTGVRVKETWLTGQTTEEAVGTILA